VILPLSAPSNSNWLRLSTDIVVKTPLNVSALILVEENDASLVNPVWIPIRLAVVPEISSFLWRPKQCTGSGDPLQKKNNSYISYIEHYLDILLFTTSYYKSDCHLKHSKQTMIGQEMNWQLYWNRQLTIVIPTR